MLVVRPVQLFKCTMDMLFQCMLGYQVELDNEQSLSCLCWSKYGPGRVGRS